MKIPFTFAVDEPREVNMTSSEEVLIENDIELQTCRKRNLGVKENTSQDVSVAVVSRFLVTFYYVVCLLELILQLLGDVYYKITTIGFGRGKRR